MTNETGTDPYPVCQPRRAASIGIALARGIHRDDRSPLGLVRRARHHTGDDPPLAAAPR